MFESIKEKILTLLAEKFLPRLVNGLLKVAAGALVTHGLMKPGTEANWIAANSELLIGIATYLLAQGYSYWQHRTVVAAKNAALDEVQAAASASRAAPLVIASLLLGIGATFAQEPLPAAGPAPGHPGVADVLLQAGREALVYVQEHGEVGAGYFVILDRGHVVGKGPGTAQSVYPVEFTPGGAVQVRLGVAHASVPAPEKSWELAMATASVKLLDLTPAERLSDAPIVAKALRLRWGGLRGGLFVGTPVDDLLLAAGAQVQWEFGK